MYRLLSPTYSRLITGVYGMIFAAGLCWSWIGSAAEISSKRAVINHLVTLGQLMYQDSVDSASQLKQAIYEFTANPSETTHHKVKLAYRKSRVAYQQTEAFRFAHPEVDELEGRVNAWPLDEGFIDYVHSGNKRSQTGLISQSFLKLGPAKLSLKHFNVSTLRALHEFAGDESHVATGYHAIEFLLWGQDLNGMNYGSGQRSYTDYVTSSCEVGDCKRRRDYLIAVTDLLVDDLNELAALFGSSGAVRVRLDQTQDDKALNSIIEGLASLSYGELAGERMKLGLLLSDPEEEHDCFSDLTHLSHYYNVIGIHNIYTGSFRDLSGQTTQGPSLAQYAKSLNASLYKQLNESFADTLSHARLIYNMAEHTGSAKPMSYDMMLAADNKAGHQLIQNLIDALKTQTDHLVAFGSQLGFTLQPEGSDSLDDPSKVLKEATSQE